MIPLTKPTLLLNKNICQNNILWFSKKCLQLGVQARPHFKTHQSADIGEWFRELGINKITVSSLQMAEYFTSHGWNDITVAIPVNIHEWALINTLAKKIKLNLIVVSANAVNALQSKLTSTVNIFVEIDTGHHRTGIASDNFNEIDATIAATQNSNNTIFAGFISHAGHSYNCRMEPEKILEIHRQSCKTMLSLKEKYQVKFPGIIVSVGDTPTFSLADNFTGIDEVRPGNFVFYDVTQYYIGSCGLEQIAVALACPVIAVYEERNEVVVHAGAVHLSKDIIEMASGVKSYGMVAPLTENGWQVQSSTLYVKSLSQEHGIITGNSYEVKKFQTGQWLAILPVHSCLTADAMGCYVCTSGEIIQRVTKN